MAEKLKKRKRGKKMQVRRVENMAGGEGHVIIRDILEQDKLGEKCRMYAEVTLEPGCSLGVHEHRGECESYYILQGTGEYTDDGNKRPVQAGDVTVTPSGHSHGLANTGDADLKFMALILLD